MYLNCDGFQEDEDDDAGLDVYLHGDGLTESAPAIHSQPSTELERGWPMEDVSGIDDILTPLNLLQTDEPQNSAAAETDNSTLGFDKIIIFLS